MVVGPNLAQTSVAFAPVVSLGFMGCGGSKVAVGTPSSTPAAPAQVGAPPTAQSQTATLTAAPPRVVAPPAPAPPAPVPTVVATPASKVDDSEAFIAKLREESAAHKKAAKHIQKVADHMATLPEESPSWLGQANSSYWDYFDGKHIEAAMQHTPLIDIEYLIELAKAGGVMPVGKQRVPKAALIGAHNVWRLKLWNKRLNKTTLPVLVFSYPWLDWFHPDRLGAQLKRVLPFLEAMFAEAKTDSPSATVGVLIGASPDTINQPRPACAYSASWVDTACWLADFLCLPQKPFDNDAQTQEFRVSLSNING